MNILRDESLAPEGRVKIDWVQDFMPALTAIRRRFEQEKPFAGKRIAMSIHLEAKTAYLALSLAAGGAEVHATGCNPLSTQDDVAAGLASLGVNVYAWHGATDEEYTAHLTQALACRPHLIIDDGGDLLNLLCGSCKDFAENLIGGCEETTTGVHRLRARAAAGQLPWPMIDVNDAQCKHFFDNRYGTGQSVWDAILHTTNLLVAGKTVVVAGYGYCGRGVAARAKGLGAKVIVTETDPVRALEAHMDGFMVMPMLQAARQGDLFITTTGCRDILTAEHFQVMKDNALLCNAGHFNVEINMDQLQAMTVHSYLRRENIRGYVLSDGRTLNLLAEGRLVNLAAGNGHPAEIMDMSFAIQSLSLEYLLHNGHAMAPEVYQVPAQIDEAVARVKLQAMGLAIDALTDEQSDYLSGWEV